MRSTKKQAVMDPSKISRSRQEEMLKRYDTDLNEQEGTPDKQEGAARGAAAARGPRTEVGSVTGISLLGIERWSILRAALKP